MKPMYNIALLLFLIIGFGGSLSQVFAQKNAITFQFQGLDGGLAYQRKINKQLDIQTSIMVFGRREKDPNKRAYLLRAKPLYSSVGLGIVVESRLYVLRKAASLAGLYVSPIVSYQYHGLEGREKIDEVETGSFFSFITPIYLEGFKNVHTVGTGLKAGGQYIFGKHFSLDAGVSLFRNHIVGDRSRFVLENGTVIPFRADIDGTCFYFHLGLGVAF